ncbi:hypothetical protein [Methanobrevibacter arboriphilus]|uniref:Uncharacterized protein n=1 Tax=Methanobrevibacter arboriphilus TaxID=39441 RepID=A0ACA8R4H5_METAZ|nr:hypothetical protein [Methanobrevibacter arboriphilus]BBL62443.1 hypothetical protein MarbSA_14830 [Methanobrevibacter arboriphilus]
MLVGYELNSSLQVVCWYFDLEDLEVSTIEVADDFIETLENKQYKIINNKLVRDISKETVLNRIMELETQQEPLTDEEYLERLENDA